MPAHQVGSLDAWLGNPFANWINGVPAVQVLQGHSTRPRSLLSGPPRSLPAAERTSTHEVASGRDDESSTGQDAVGRLACAACADDSLLSALISDNNTVDVLFEQSSPPRMATSPKRKSLLSEQLRTATSLPLATYRHGPEEADADDGFPNAQAAHALAHSASMERGSLARLLDADSLPASREAPPPAAGPVNATGPDASQPSSFLDASYDKLLLLGYMDADAASSTCGGGASSLAASSSAGCYSSGSNVLHYCYRDREESTGGGGAGGSSSIEPLPSVRSLPLSPAAVAAAHPAGTEAAACRAECLSSQPRQCFGGLLDQESPLGARTPSSLPEHGAAADTTSLSSTAPSSTSPFARSTTAATPTPTTCGSAAHQHNNHTDTPTDKTDGSLALCSVTDLVSTTPSTDRTSSTTNCTAVQIAVATHLMAEPAVLTPCMAPHDLAAEPEAVAAAAAEPLSFSLVARSASLSVSLPGLKVAAAVTPVASAAAQLLGSGGGCACCERGGGGGGGSSSGGTTASSLASCESPPPPPPPSPPLVDAVGVVNQRSLSPQLQLQGVEVAGEAERRERSRQWCEGVPVGTEGSPRGGKGVTFASLFSTVLVLPAGGGAGAVQHPRGHAVGPYDASGCLQHSLSMGTGSALYRGEWTGGGGGGGGELGGWEQGAGGGGGAAGPTASDASFRDMLNARRSFDVSKGQSRARVSTIMAGGASRAGSINGLLEADVPPAMYEGTVRRGLPRRAVPLARAMTHQPVTDEMLRSLMLDSSFGGFVKDLN